MSRAMRIVVPMANASNLHVRHIVAPGPIYFRIDVIDENVCRKDALFTFKGLLYILPGPYAGRLHLLRVDMKLFYGAPAGPGCNWCRGTGAVKLDAAGGVPHVE